MLFFGILFSAEKGERTFVLFSFSVAKMAKREQKQGQQVPISDNFYNLCSLLVPCMLKITDNRRLSQHNATFTTWVVRPDMEVYKLTWLYCSTLLPSANGTCH